MGVSLRYCDGCGGKLVSEQLESDEVLRIKDKVFCPTCKPKVIQQIKAQRAQQAAAAGGGKPAPRVASAAVPGKGKGTAPARGAGTRRAAPGRRGAPAGRRRAGAGAEAGNGAGAGAAPGRTTARKGRGAPPKGRRPGGSGAAAAAEDSPELEGPQGFQMKKRSNAIPITAAIVLGLGGIAAIAFIFMQPDKEPEKITVKKVEAPKIDDDLERSKSTLANAKKYRADHPEKFLEAWIRFKQIGAFKTFEKYLAGPEALQLADQLQKDWKAEANRRFSAIEARVAGLIAQNDYVEAAAAAEEIDPVIDSYRRNFHWMPSTELTVLRMDCAKLVEGKEYLEELVRKATKYAARNEGDIAEAIMERFDKKSYGDLEIWSVYEGYMKRVKKTGLSAIKELEKEIAQRQDAKQAAELAAEKAAREKEWLERKDRIAWQTHINPNSDYNWILKHGDWKWLSDGGHAVLRGKNPGGTSTRAAPFAAHWQDYVLRFEMKLTKGSMEVSPRTVVHAGRGAGTDRGGIRDQSELVTLGTEDFTYRQYHWITIEVVGDKVTVFKGKEATEANIWKTFDAEDGDGDYRLLSAGGFCLYVNNESEVEIRNLQTKLVSHNRKGMF